MIYQEENLSNRYPSDKRTAVLCRSAEKFLADIQKTEVRYNGIKKLESAPANKLTEKDHKELLNQLTKVGDKFSLIIFLFYNIFRQRLCLFILNSINANCKRQFHL